MKISHSRNFVARERCVAPLGLGMLCNFTQAFRLGLNNSAPLALGFRQVYMRSFYLSLRIIVDLTSWSPLASSAH